MGFTAESAEDAACPFGLSAVYSCPEAINSLNPLTVPNSSYTNDQATYDPEPIRMRNQPMSRHLVFLMATLLCTAGAIEAEPGESSGRGIGG